MTKTIQSIQKNAGLVFYCYPIVYIQIFNFNCTFLIQYLFTNESILLHEEDKRQLILLLQIVASKF